MIGIDAATGKPLSGEAHLRQSIVDILTTPVGSRVMRREYGSMLYRLVDAPLTPALLVQIYAATVDALTKWEPRIRVTRVQAETADSGHVSLTITARRLVDGRAVTLEGIVL
jgi:hypothetical protein